MSYTAVYAADENGDMQQLGTLRNAWRGAMHVWTSLGEKFVPGFNVGKWMAGIDRRDAAADPIWGLWDDERLSRGERIVLGTTFDNVVAGPDIMAEVADALDAFAPSTENLTGQAALVRQALNRGSAAVGWHQTSVCESPWSLNLAPEESMMEVLTSARGRVVDDALIEAVNEASEGDWRPFNIERDKDRKRLKWLGEMLKGGTS